MVCQAGRRAAARQTAVAAQTQRVKPLKHKPVAVATSNGKPQGVVRAWVAIRARPARKVRRSRVGRKQGRYSGVGGRQNPNRQAGGAAVAVRANQRGKGRRRWAGRQRR